MPFQWSDERGHYAESRLDAKSCGLRSPAKVFCAIRVGKTEALTQAGANSVSIQCQNWNLSCTQFRCEQFGQSGLTRARQTK